MQACYAAFFGLRQHCSRRDVILLNIKIIPGVLHGSLVPPASKSQCHREIICAALSQGESRIKNVCFSNDIEATLRGMSALGAHFARKGAELCVTGGVPHGLPHIDCGESATTLRLLIPVALALCGCAEFSGAASLMARPLEPYFRIFRKKNVDYILDNNTLTLRGSLSAGEYTLTGDISSQFFSGMLLALPLLGGESCLRSENRIQSQPYIDMTLDALHTHGVNIVQDTGKFYIRPQRFAPCDCELESDWSHAAMWLAAKELGCRIELRGLNANSRQGDKIICEYLRQLRMGGDVELDVSQCPDIVPALALAASVRGGNCAINNAARLRMKECDRLDAISEVLNSLGANIKQRPDGLDIKGTSRLRGGVCVDPRRDHRIAMMAAVAAAICEKPVIISDAECVAKSYPEFWHTFEALGGAVSAV